MQYLPVSLWGAFLLALIVVIPLSANTIQRNTEINALYLSAEVNCSSGDYSAAIDDLFEIMTKETKSSTHYKDTYALYDYCCACKYYEENDIEKAYDYLPNKDSFHNQSDEWLKEYHLFSTRIEQEYKAHIHQKEEEEKQAFEDTIVNGVPFVGMPESRIADTTLGSPDPAVRHNTEMKSGQVYKANLYDWRINGHRIFCARCSSGKVVQVWDERNKDTSKPYVPYQPEKKTTSSRYDPYDVYDYDDLEDFYYDHEDEFDDYDDAEDYYDEAWGE